MYPGVYLPFGRRIGVVMHARIMYAHSMILGERRLQEAGKPQDRAN
jgi:hypothetical protein